MLTALELSEEFAFVAEFFAALAGAFGLLRGFGIVCSRLNATPHRVIPIVSTHDQIMHPVAADCCNDQGWARGCYEKRRAEFPFHLLLTSCLQAIVINCSRILQPHNYKVDQARGTANLKQSCKVFGRFFVKIAGKNVILIE